jgi:hypothetical protein
MAQPLQLIRGSPYPLGTTWDGLGVNFALLSVARISLFARRKNCISSAWQALS